MAEEASDADTSEEEDGDAGDTAGIAPTTEEVITEVDTTGLMAGRDIMEDTMMAPVITTPTLTIPRIRILLQTLIRLESLWARRRDGRPWEAVFGAQRLMKSESSTPTRRGRRPARQREHYCARPGPARSS